MSDYIGHIKFYAFHDLFVIQRRVSKLIGIFKKKKKKKKKIFKTKTALGLTGHDNKDTNSTARSKDTDQPVLKYQTNSFLQVYARSVYI